MGKNLKFKMEYSINDSSKTQKSDQWLNTHVNATKGRRLSTPTMVIGAISLGVILLFACVTGVYLLRHSSSTDPSSSQPPTNPSNDSSSTIPTENIEPDLYSYIEDTVSGASKFFKPNQKNIIVSELPKLKESFFLLYLFNSAMFEFIYIDIYRCAISFISQEYFANNDKSHSLEMFKSDQLETLWTNSELCRKWAFIFNLTVNENTIPKKVTATISKFSFDKSELTGGVLLGDKYDSYDAFNGIKTFFQLMYTINESVFSSILGAGVDKNNNKGNMFEINRENDKELNKLEDFGAFINGIIKENVFNLSSHAFFKFTGRKLVVKGIKLWKFFTTVGEQIDLTPYNTEKAKIMSDLYWTYQIDYIEGLINGKHAMILMKENMYWIKEENKEITPNDEDAELEIEIKSIGLNTEFNATRK
eukprot:GAHX01000477.1.p1 GENE.GAHX01000477.1~~GAHX01000477.1.p1  ORF type:complete len:419 (-),score=92.58 GAHX01000477.1:35-1291(-)